VHVAVNGEEAAEAVRLSLEQNEPYELICLDIMKKIPTEKVVTKATFDQGFSTIRAPV